jgi:hypothetical protein
MNAIAGTEGSPSVLYHALSLKQPWATLLVHGIKSIEIRRWRTPYTGRLLIHAARGRDERDEAWAHLPEHLQDHATLGGGIVGYGTLSSCKVYRTQVEFDADHDKHRNEPVWFEPRGLYGFVFEDLQVVPFEPVPGFFRIFEVELDIEI